MQRIAAHISLETIARNASLVKERTDVPLIAVVKDDGYGHGAEAVAHALKGRARMFAVSTAEEGAALRVAGVEEEILVFTPPLTEEEALVCGAYSLTPTLSSAASFRLYLRAAERFGLPGRVQLAFNTGMNRYGFRPDRAKSVFCEAKACGLDVSGVYSHFYAPECEEAREEQYRLFLGVSERAKKVFPQTVLHLAATGGILAGKRYHFDMVRSGIALYGYLPAGFEGRLAVKPAMKVYAAVSRRGTFLGGGAGYAAAEREYGALHTLTAGYGGGFFRTGGLGIGNLCMDACVREGDAPFGSLRLVLRNAEEYARAHGTTAYEVLVHVGKNAERVYR